MYALIVLQERMRHPQFDRKLLMHSTEGYAGGPDKAGWKIERGTMTVAGHRFGLAGLLDEMDSHKTGLFA